MDIFLDALKKSVQHLQTVDKIFSRMDHPNKKEYKKIKKRILKLNSNDPDLKFTDSLYVGGKSGSGLTGYGRQMILSDIIQYIFFGRGYLYTQQPGNQESDDGKQWTKRRKTFIELLLQTINLLIIIESSGVQSKLRKKLLDKLATKIGEKSFFKEDEMKILHEALKLHDGDLGFPEQQLKNENKKFKKEVQEILKKISMMEYPKKSYDQLTDIQKAKVDKKKESWQQLNEYYDSLLPKSGGGLWNELIVFFYLIRRTSVLIIPLLLTQRILSKNSMLKPPDYLVIGQSGSARSKLFGIEVGGGKSRQSTNFSTEVPGIKMVTTENNNIPPRCPLCGEFILFCPKVIEDCCDIEENPLLRIKKEVRCIPECNIYKPYEIINGKCPYTQYQGSLEKSTTNKSKISGDVSKYHYHYSCVKKAEKQAQEKIKKEYADINAKKPNGEKKYKKTEVTVLKTDYPYLGVSAFDKLTKDEIVCFGQYDMMQKKDPKNCDMCNFRKDCRKITSLDKILSQPNDKNARKKVKKLLS
ncbi:hypothetical protein HX827_05185 [Marine Group I thaumarchaeote]|uniref:Uncharacterized protein n=1 Tax=Marine Group I thaumarchaeote TaxID=2511932 RepID=A0A7K4NUP9_9ARCH|nr:hypothetical protein [Marine Group I thaumarchaeote]